MDDAKAILETYVPDQMIEDMIVWAKSIDGIYNVKTGYRFWHTQHMRNESCIISK